MDEFNLSASRPLVLSRSEKKDSIPILFCDEFENRIRFAVLWIDTWAGSFENTQGKKEVSRKSALEHAHNMGWS